MDQVNQNHQGRYTCTPYNAQGTQGSSGQMEVLVRKPPTFTVEPESMYQRKISESVEMHCYAQEAEGTQKPKIQWHRVCENAMTAAVFLSPFARLFRNENPACRPDRFGDFAHVT